MTSDSVSPGPSMTPMKMSPQAYVKIVLHSLKYPHLAVSGVLLGTKTSSGGWKISDTVPVQHQAIALTPTLETALCCIDKLGSGQSPPLSIVGLYFANQRLDDSSLDAFTKRVGAKLIEQTPNALLVRVANGKLGEADVESVLTPHVWNADKKDWKVNQKMLSIDDSCTTATSLCLEMNLERVLCDFDNHLDHPTESAARADYWNEAINQTVDGVLAQIRQ